MTRLDGLAFGHLSTLNFEFSPEIRSCHVASWHSVAPHSCAILPVACTSESPKGAPCWHCNGPLREHLKSELGIPQRDSDKFSPKLVRRCVLRTGYTLVPRMLVEDSMFTVFTADVGKYVHICSIFSACSAIFWPLQIWMCMFCCSGERPRKRGVRSAKGLNTTIYKYIVFIFGSFPCRIATGFMFRIVPCSDNCQWHPA